MIQHTYSWASMFTPRSKIETNNQKNVKLLDHILNSWLIISDGLIDELARNVVKCIMGIAVDVKLNNSRNKGVRFL